MNSPFTNKLGTNYIPSDSEIEVIKHLLVDPRAELSQLNNEIVRLSSHLDALTRKRDTLHDALSGHIALVSPARRLPADIIRNVFIHSLPDNFADLPGRNIPLLLSGICSFWRCIALTTPSLWARVHIRVGSSDFFHQAMRIDAIKLWLSRSGVVPLAISLSIGPYIHHQIVAEWINMITLLRNRWRDIQLEMSSDVFSMFPDLSEDRLPELERLKLNARTNYTLSSENSSIIGLFRARNLQHISLFGIENLSISPPRWIQVTALSLQEVALGEEQGTSVTQAFYILSQCPKLEKLVLRIQASSAFDSAEAEPIWLRALESLSISEHSERDAGELLKRLKLPALRHVAYYRGGGEVDEFQSLMTLLSFSSVSSTIETLRINSRIFVPEMLQQCLQLIPTLKHLEIYMSYPLAELLPLFTPSKTNSTLSPSLEVFKCIGYAGFPYNAIAEFLKLRIALPFPGGRLQKVRLSCIDMKSEDIHSEITSLCLGGREIDIRYSVKEGEIIWPDSHFARVKEFYV